MTLWLLILVRIVANPAANVLQKLLTRDGASPLGVIFAVRPEQIAEWQARVRVLSIVDWLNRHGALDTLDEANALLAAAGMSELREAQPLGRLVSPSEMTMASLAPAPSWPWPVVALAIGLGLTRRRRVAVALSDPWTLLGGGVP